MIQQPTLTLSVPDGPVTFSVRFDRWDGARPQFWYRVESNGAGHEAEDLRLGASTDPSLAEAMRALLDFFSAFAESVAYEHRNPGESSENGSLFSDDLRDVAYGIGADDLSLLARDVCWREDD